MRIRRSFRPGCASFSSTGCSRSRTANLPAPLAERRCRARQRRATANNQGKCAGRAGGTEASFTRKQTDKKGKTDDQDRSEEHTSELQSLMRISYAVFCLKKKT